MTFRVVENTKCKLSCTEIIAEGVIEPDSAETMRVMVARVGAAQAKVQLSSPGGSLVGAIKLGNALRELRADVIVKRNTQCTSACVYALLGGSARSVEAGARVGIHRIHAYAPDAPSDAVPTVLADYAIEMLQRYAINMGVDPTFIIMAAKDAPESVRYLSIAELHHYRVVTRTLAR